MYRVSKMCDRATVWSHHIFQIWVFVRKKLTIYYCFALIGCFFLLFLVIFGSFCLHKTFKHIYLSRKNKIFYKVCAYTMKTLIIYKSDSGITTLVSFCNYKVTVGQKYHAKILNEFQKNPLGLWWYLYFF